MSNLENYLKPTFYLNYEDERFQEFIKPFAEIQDKSIRAEQFYLHVRDYFLYDPYHLDLRPSALQASHLVAKNRAWCVEKAIVFAAGLRAFGIPARLGYAIVENHIGVEKLIRILKSNKIVFHGYVEVYLDKFQSWTKATPAFDVRVCRLNKVEPLIWNGTRDSLFQAYSQGNKFMEYHHNYGTFDDVPSELMQREMRKYYPHLFDGSVPNSKQFSFKFL
jgi:transglutaminase-like putative cysteine protease